MSMAGPSDFGCDMPDEFCRVVSISGVLLCLKRVMHARGGALPLDNGSRCCPVPVSLIAQKCYFREPRRSLFCAARNRRVVGVSLAAEGHRQLPGPQLWAASP